MPVVFTVETAKYIDKCYGNGQENEVKKGKGNMLHEGLSK